MARTQPDLINYRMNASLDYIGNSTGCLGDLPLARTWCFRDQHIRDFIDEMIDYADIHGATTNIGDFRDVWHSDYVQDKLRLLLMRNTFQRLSAVWVRDTLEMDPVRNEVVEMIWSHL
jgi:hypothetical protein